MDSRSDRPPGARVVGIDGTLRRVTRPPSDISRDGSRRSPDPAPPSPERDAALGAIASGSWLLTSCFEGDRVGVPLRWVQRAGAEPPLISAVVRKGNRIAPLIRDSRAFALNLLPPEQPLLAKRFLNGTLERLGDPFDTLQIERCVTNSPCLKNALVSIDCELFRHIDLEEECEMYVGLVLATRLRQ
jgi:flavin reductase (DIM6/NTAB) family NADH-FMN oxidoreductase RutF